MLAAVRSVVNTAEDSLLCVAFANEAGVRLLEPAIKDGARRVRLLATTVFGDTTAAALARASAVGIEVRTLNLAGGTYHPKLYLGLGNDRAAALVGSANLTSGLLRNIEVAALLSGDPRKEPFVQLQELAEGWWDHPAAQPWTEAAPAAAAQDTFAGELWDHLQQWVKPGTTVLTLRDSRPNVVAEVSQTAMWIHTERSRALGRGPQEVPAWMFNIAWDYLTSHGTLSNATLLNDLNVHRSSLVCAVLAKVPGVEILSRQPIRLGVRRDLSLSATAAEDGTPYP